MTISPMIYGGGPFYSGGTAVMSDLKASGFTTVVVWTLHVADKTGDLIFNNTPLITNGSYVGDTSWPNALAGLKTGTTSVNRILFSVGSGGVQDFTHIQSLLNAGEGKPGGKLYESFNTLRSTFPTIDGIDFDNEDLIGGSAAETTVVDFAVMLSDIGFKQITFCPCFQTQTFWAACLDGVQKQAPGLVTGFNIQTYGGTGGPSSWISAVSGIANPPSDPDTFITPGVWSVHGKDSSGNFTCTEGNCPSAIQTEFAGWKSSGINSGFIWMYDDIQGCETSGKCNGNPMGSAAYAAAIADGLS